VTIAGKYSVRIAETEQDVQLAQAFRAKRFGTSEIIDTDLYDAYCKHVLIEAVGTNEIQGCFRLINFSKGMEIEASYSAQFYNLSRLKVFDRPMLEVGRFCLGYNNHNPDLLRVAWAFITKYVDQYNIALMFGCSSFAGINAAHYFDVFSLLKEHHLAPERWKPQPKFSETFGYAEFLKGDKPVPKRAYQNMPALLRSYIAMGGWVSDHAVIDRNMDTLHVFTGVEVGAIPETRAKLLRSDAELLSA
jgi:putative hemolysin